MTGTEPTEQQPPDTRDWDAFIKATAVRITAVLLLFVLVWGIAYFPLTTNSRRSDPSTTLKRRRLDSMVNTSSPPSGVSHVTAPTDR